MQNFPILRSLRRFSPAYVILVILTAKNSNKLAEKIWMAINRTAINWPLVSPACEIVFSQRDQVVGSNRMCLKRTHRCNRSYCKHGDTSDVGYFIPEMLFSFSDSCVFCAIALCLASNGKSSISLELAPRRRSSFYVTRRCWDSLVYFSRILM